MIEIILDASSLELFEPCPRKYYYDAILNLTTVRRRNAFDIGSYFHEVLAHYYSSPLKDIPRLRSAFDFSSQVQLFVKFGIKDIDEQKFYRRRIAEYFNFWDYEDQRLEFLAVEKGFSYLLYEDSSRRYILEGKIDLIGKGKPYGLFVMDHKTQSRKDDKYPYNHQVCNYMNYMRRQGKPADYFVYNYIGIQDNLPPDGMRRQIYAPPPGMLDQWEKEVKRTFDDLFDIMTKCNSNGMTNEKGERIIVPDIEAFKRKRSACDSSKYGLCHFHKLCSIPDGSKWYEAVRKHYKEKEQRWRAW